MSLKKVFFFLILFKKFVKIINYIFEVLRSEECLRVFSAIVSASSLALSTYYVLNVS